MSYRRAISKVRPVSPFNRHFSSSPSVKTEFGSFSFLLDAGHSYLQTVHTITGLPWYLSIPLSTVVLRSITTLPIAISNRVRTQKQQKLAPLLGATGWMLRNRLKQSSSASQKLTEQQVSVLAAKEQRKRRVALFKLYNCQAWKSVILLPAVQIPVWVTISLVLRAMCGGGYSSQYIASEPGFSSAFGWLESLATPDPLGILPTVVGAVSMANVEWNSINALNPANSSSSRDTISIPTIVSNITRVGSLLFMTAAFQAPSALCIYWISSNTFSLVQNLILDKFLPMRYKPSGSISPQVVELEKTPPQAAIKSETVVGS